MVPPRYLHVVDFKATAQWLLDQNDDGSVDIVFDDSAADVRVVVDAMGLLDDPPWQKTGVCGAGGDFIRVRSTIVVAPWSPLHIFWDGVTRSSESLVRNQAGTDGGWKRRGTVPKGRPGAVTTDAATGLRARAAPATNAPISGEIPAACAARAVASSFAR